MPYIPVPKDLTRVKTKFLFNLTKRQLVCFGGGALVGIPLFFLLKGPLGNSSAAICMIVVMMHSSSLHSTRKTACRWRSTCCTSLGLASYAPSSGLT